MSREKPGPRSGDWVFSAALVLVALVPRVFVAIAWPREPVWDGHYYHFGATRIAEGLGYSEDVVISGMPVWRPWCHYPVGYSGLLGGVYRIFGTDLVVAPLVNAVIGMLTVLVVHRLGRYFLSENRARVAGALTALHPGLIAYSAVVMTEPLAGLLVLVAGLSAARFRRSAVGWVLAGIALGLATLVRPPSLLAGPLLGLVFFSPSASRLRAFRRAAVKTVLVTSVAVLTVLPWTLRNCRVMDGCALVSTNGGWNLAIGALTQTGRFHTLTAEDGCPVVTGQVQQDRCWGRVGLDVIRRDPLRWLSVVPLKLRHTYNHESFAIEYLREADPESWPESRRDAGRSLLTLAHHLLMVGAALSLLGRPRRKHRRALAAQLALGVALLAFLVFAAVSPDHPFFWLAVLTPILLLVPRPGTPSLGGVGQFLAGLVLATTLTHAVAFGDDRYHVVVSPVLCLLAAAALRRATPDGVGAIADRTLHA